MKILKRKENEDFVNYGAYLYTSLVFDAGIDL